MNLPSGHWVTSLVALLLIAAATGTTVPAQDVNVRNVQAYQQGKNVIIEYDLKGDNRVTFDVDLRLERGWNVVVRSTRTEAGLYGAREHVWRVVGEDGVAELGDRRWDVFDAFRWYANLTDRVPGDPDVTAVHASPPAAEGRPTWMDVRTLRDR